MHRGELIRPFPLPYLCLLPAGFAGSTELEVIAGHFMSAKHKKPIWSEDYKNVPLDLGYLTCCKSCGIIIVGLILIPSGRRFMKGKEGLFETDIP